jgi:hypothetical protein
MGGQAPIEEESTGEVFVKPVLKFSAEDEEDQARFNPSNPVSSFRKMIGFNKRDMVA